MKNLLINKAKWKMNNLPHVLLMVLKWYYSIRKLICIERQHSSLYHQALSQVKFMHKPHQCILNQKQIFNSMQQTCHPLDKSQLFHHTLNSKRLDYSWTFHLVSWLVVDVAGSDSASWSKQMVDGGYTYAEENLGTAASETLSGIWQKYNAIKHTYVK